MSLPKPSGGFEWVQASWGWALRCAPLGELAPNIFSTRDLVLEDSERVAPPESGWAALAQSVGASADALVRMRQIHCADVFVADRMRAMSVADVWPEADIAASIDPGVVLTVKAADCVPALLADQHSGAVAAVHAGWRGTAAGAINAAVEALQLNFGARPRDLIAVVGPSIGPCCYEVSDDLRAHFSAHADAERWFSDGPRPHLDLWTATRDQLERAGVPVAHIHVCELCTFHHPALFHSYRRDGTRAGRLVAAIRSSRDRKP